MPGPTSGRASARSSGTSRSWPSTAFGSSASRWSRSRRSIRDTAQAALDLVEVEYEELPAVFDVDDGDRRRTPRWSTPSRRRRAPTFADIILDSEGGPNVCNTFKLRKGDIEDGFAAVGLHLRGHLHQPGRPARARSRRTACVADVGDDEITIHTTSQIPFMVRSQIAEIFGLPASRVRVVVQTLGGGYGAKCYPNIEPIAAVLSRVAGRPVRLHLSREEEFIDDHEARRPDHAQDRPPEGRHDRRPQEHLPLQHRCLRRHRPAPDQERAAIGTGGPTSIPHVWIDSYAVYTNLPPAGAFRGYGISQAAWAYETPDRHDRRAAGHGPLRAAHAEPARRTAQTIATGEVHGGLPLPRAARRGRPARSAGRWPQVPERNGNKVRAKGLSLHHQGHDHARRPPPSIAKLNDDGSAATS